MTGFDFDAAVRWAPLNVRRTLERRPDEALPFVGTPAFDDRSLLFDTCVYIDQMQDRTPRIVDQLIDRNPASHSTIAIQELMHTVGVLDPGDSRTSTVIDAIKGQIKAMRLYRVFAPDPDILGRAAVLAGILCRLQGYANDDRLRALHDCVLFLQAQKLGLTLLTGNVRDFDYLLQLFEKGRVLFYRRA